MPETDTEKLDNIVKKLDLLIAIFLAKNGMNREEIAEILGMSYKTIERMFAGKFNKIKPMKE